MCDCAEYVGDLCVFFCSLLFFVVSREWIERVPPENILRVLICLRMLMRDHVFQVQPVTLALLEFVWVDNWKYPLYNFAFQVTIEVGQKTIIVKVTCSLGLTAFTFMYCTLQQKWLLREALVQHDIIDIDITVPVHYTLHVLLINGDQ